MAAAAASASAWRMPPAVSSALDRESENVLAGTGLVYIPSLRDAVLAMANTSPVTDTAEAAERVLGLPRK